MVLGESCDQSECYLNHPPWSCVVFGWALPLLAFHFPTYKKSSWAWPGVPGYLGSPIPEVTLAQGDQLIPEKFSDRMICVDSSSIWLHWFHVQVIITQLSSRCVSVCKLLSLTSQDLPALRRLPGGHLGQEAQTGRQRLDLTLLPWSILDGLSHSGKRLGLWSSLLPTKTSSSNFFVTRLRSSLSQDSAEHEEISSGMLHSEILKTRWSQTLLAGDLLWRDHRQRQMSAMWRRGPPSSHPGTPAPPPPTP